MSVSPTSTTSAPTLLNVAERAGVSTATVSRVLNTPGKVGEATREKVLAAIRELGYAPNFSARALAAGRTNTVGVVIPTMENAIFARGVQAFQEELGLHGITLLIASSGYQKDVEAQQIRTLVARGADALLLIGYQRDQAEYEFLEKRGVPALVAWAYDAEREQAAIGFDNTEAMKVLTEAVLDRGHTSLAVISAPVAENDRASGRVAGVLAALAAHDLEIDTVPVVETPYGFETGAAAFRQLRAERPDITAVICGNDVLAVGALLAAKEMGLSVPEDISITGFDDIDLAMLAEPSLTTVHVPHSLMGRRAAQMILQMINGEVTNPKQELQTSIELRRTLGRVRA